MQGGFWATVGKRRFFLLWVSLILLVFLSISLLNSLGQILSGKDGANSSANGPGVSIDNPVFSPLARASHIRTFEFSPGAHVIYDGNAGRNFLQDNASEPEWWTTADQAPPDSDPSLEGHDRSPSGNVSDNPVPRLRSGDFDLQARAREFISAGVADLLDLLRDKDVNRSSDNSGSKSNPFDEVLKNSSSATSSSATSSENSATAADKSPKTGSTDSAKPDQTAAAPASSSGGTPAQANGTFLFIGSFGDEQVATVVGTSQGLVSLSDNSAASFNLAGLGNQSYDLKIILRNAENQESIAYGDVNGDGYPDLVVTNKVDNVAYVYLNDGQGNYILNSQIDGGLGPAATAIADFNGDGSPDIALMTQIAKQIVVDGPGLRKFIFLPTSKIDKAYSSLIPYDYNGDGLNDLLLTDYLGQTVSVYLNQGDATFVESGSSPLDSFPYLQSTADLNGDGIADTVYVQHFGNQISIVVVNGADGSVSSLVNAIFDPSVYFVVGDFNQDGVIDIGIAHRQ
jgi:hypothetical protein